VPFSVRECTVGTGATCGSIYLTKNFEDLVRRRLGSKAPQILTQKALTQCARAFENLIKCTFDPEDENAEDEYELPIPGAPDSPDIGLEDGYLRLSKFVISSPL
jgi:hypothetical protein